ncbi:hypothetical protein SDC9_140887 [bioreactor metagenome]|uniref:Acyltransferase 3 domain-containing protein n=1 Tax=bioreactor metagenome TaxID=1076179 RepID=A0A645DWS1_9ZZZZ
MLYGIDAGNISGSLYYIYSFLRIISIPFLNVYVIISGYFLVNSGFKIKKIFLFWIQTFFYSLALYLLISLLTGTQISIKTLLYSSLPISGNRYWFSRVYFGMYILSPFFSVFLKAMTKRQYKLFLWIITSLFCLWRMIIPFATTLNSEGGNSIIWFFTLYAYAGYLRLHFNRNFNYKKLFLLFCASQLVTYIGYLFINFLSNSIGLAGKGSSIITEYTSITVLTSSLLIFLTALNMDQIKSKKIQNAIYYFSNSSYSVYLIHENPDVRGLLWSNTLYMLNPYLTMGISLIFSPLLYILCMLIDKISWKPIYNILNKIQWMPVQKKIDNIMENQVNLQTYKHD